jgi:hypothetical protein
VKIDFDDSKVAEVRALLADIKNGAEWAMSKSINAAITTTKSQGIKKTANIINLQQKIIRKDFTDKKATNKNLDGWIHVEGKGHGLASFGAKEVGNFGGIKVKVLKSSGEKIISNAFITKHKKKDGDSYKSVYRRANRGGGKTGVQSRERVKFFASIRKGGKNSMMKYPVERLRGPDTYSQVKKFEGELQQIGADRLEERLAAEVDRILTKYG